MITFARMAEVMKITKELALEGFMHFIRAHEGKAERYPDFVEARTAAYERLQQLAVMERAFGTAKVDHWLEESVRRATKQLAEEAAKDAAPAA